LDNYTKPTIFNRILHLLSKLNALHVRACVCMCVCVWGGGDLFLHNQQEGDKSVDSNKLRQ